MIRSLTDPRRETGEMGQNAQALDEAFRDLGRKARPAPRSRWRRFVPLLAGPALVVAVGSTASALHSTDESRTVSYGTWPLSRPPTRVTVAGTTFGVAVVPAGGERVGGPSDAAAWVLSQDGSARWHEMVGEWGLLDVAQASVLGSQRATGSSMTFTFAIFPSGATAIAPSSDTSGSRQMGSVAVSDRAGTEHVFVAVSSDDDTHQPHRFAWVDSRGQQHETP